MSALEKEPVEDIKRHTASNNRRDDLVTEKDIKISLFEFAKEYKLEAMNVKLNILIGIVIGGFGYGFKYLMDMNAALVNIVNQLK
jgi:hypothetical protein